MRERQKTLAVALAVAAPAFLLTRALFPQGPMLPSPEPWMIPLFLIATGLEVAAFGFGMAKQIVVGAESRFGGGSPGARTAPAA